MATRQEQSAITRQSIIDAGFELFAELGFEATTISQIAQRAGFSRVTVYQYFANKPQIILGRLMQIQPEIHRPFEPLFARKVHTEESTYEFLMEMKSLWNRYGVEFAAIEKAMTSDADIAAQWLETLRKLSLEFPGVALDPANAQEFTALVMSLDRNFYFLYGRGHDENEDGVLRGLVKQWMTLLGPVSEAAELAGEN
ncbi:TetR/AcrR family transcriptional regulator [Corynebacterium crudilactis]|uniref:HTH tetR-type domain-containing protein n=1 Tax=Corynebacterium crudilactis TaxID=1652495 RepID=A0A172QQT7_9CORY|nr:TetR/AcrR family transcriptional regulator [Corynebacterium crudilactis]ANE03039.1 hypothetical protein ccrud_01620 [Corynebacterium crudilactis]